jgi:hypothetical protein
MAREAVVVYYSNSSTLGQKERPSNGKRDGKDACFHRSKAENISP